MFVFFLGGGSFFILSQNQTTRREKEISTKIWGKFENYALFKQVPVGPIINNDNFQNNFFYLKLIDIVVKIQARNIIEISNVEIFGFGLEKIRS